MARLIDENKAKEVLTDYYHIHTTIQRLTMDEAFSRVPTVDAIPVEFIEEYLEYQITEDKIALRMLLRGWELCKKEKENGKTN